MATPLLDLPREVSGVEVHSSACQTLGLDASAIDLEAPEAIAGLLRRAASFAAPCAPSVLRDLVMRSLTGLLSDGLEARELVERSLDALVGYGDLLELPSVEPDEGRLLHLAPPTFVWRVEGVAFLLGAARDGIDLLPSELQRRVQHIQHTRRIYAERDEDLRGRLKGFGLVDLAESIWLSPTQGGAPNDIINRANAALAANPSHGAADGLMILDSSRPVSHYRGRWQPVERQSGRFVARRSQKYGADLWCYVEIENGEVVKLLDLPRGDERGCDEAWHLQMAIDAERGSPQLYRLRNSAPSGHVIIDFFSPMPQWAQRRWDTLGEMVVPDRCLISYKMPLREFDGERGFLERSLWLRPIESV